MRSEYSRYNWRSSSDSLRASSPIWASEASLARTRERAAMPRGAARSREAHFAYPNRRACSQARAVKTRETI